MNQDAAFTHLFAVLDTLSAIAQAMHPGRLPALTNKLAEQDAHLAQYPEPLTQAANFAYQACAALRAAPEAENPMVDAYRAMRHYSRALEALADLAETHQAVSRYFLEPKYRDDPALRQRLSEPPHPDSGTFHFGNRTDQRGGFSVCVPPWYDASKPTPVITALHGGSGHGRLFLWNWLPEARSRGLIIIAPTAMGRTWSLTEPHIDSQNLASILDRVGARWNIDPARTLLTGMSDGGTFTLLSGLADGAPFTHLAPVAASFHPFLLSMTSPARLTGLPVHLTHGALDWMFPVSQARTAHRMLASAGAAVVYREIADLSHAYPRDRQPEVLDWWLTPA